MSVDIDGSKNVILRLAERAEGSPNHSVGHTS